MKSRKNLKLGKFSDIPSKTEKDAFVRKGVVGGWKDYFDDEQNQFVDEQVKNRLSGTGLVFEM